MIDPDDDRGNTTAENAMLLAFFVIVAGAGIWLLMTMADVRHAQDCVSQGRRNCAPIEAAPRPR
jgi:hypothetical protein